MKPSAHLQVDRYTGEDQCPPKSEKYHVFVSSLPLFFPPYHYYNINLFIHPSRCWFVDANPFSTISLSVYLKKETLWIWNSPLQVRRTVWGSSSSPILSHEHENHRSHTWRGNKRLRAFRSCTCTMLTASSHVFVFQRFTTFFFFSFFLIETRATVCLRLSSRLSERSLPTGQTHDVSAFVGTNTHRNHHKSNRFNGLIEVARGNIGVVPCPQSSPHLRSQTGRRLTHCPQHNTAPLWHHVGTAPPSNSRIPLTHSSQRWHLGQELIKHYCLLFLSTAGISIQFHREKKKRALKKMTKPSCEPVRLAFEYLIRDQEPVDGWKNLDGSECLEICN